MMCEAFVKIDGLLKQCPREAKYTHVNGDHICSWCRVNQDQSHFAENLEIRCRYYDCGPSLNLKNDPGIITASAYYKEPVVYGIRKRN